MKEKMVPVIIEIEIEDRSSPKAIPRSLKRSPVEVRAESHLSNVSPREERG